MQYIIYKTTNLVNDKIYIGKHQTNNLNDSYIGSGKLLSQAIKKYGRDKFVKEILFIFSSEDAMNAKEIELITEDFCKCNTNYNLGVGGEGGSHFKGRTHSQHTKDILAEKAKLITISDDGRKRISKANQTRVWDEESIKKISEKASLRYQDPIYLEKFKASMKNRPKRIQSEETKRKISETLKKKKLTREGQDG